MRLISHMVSHMHLFRSLFLAERHLSLLSHIGYLTTDYKGRDFFAIRYTTICKRSIDS